MRARDWRPTVPCMSSADTGVIDVAAAHGLTAEELRQFHEVGYVKKRA